MIASDLAIRLPMSPFLTATLARAADYAGAQSHTEVAVEHLLLALTEDPEASIVLKSSNVDIEQLNNEVSDFIGRIAERLPEGSTSGAAISPELRRILEAAAAAAQQGRRREINGAIVLAAIVGDGKSGAAHMLRSQGLTFEAAIRALQRSTVPARPAVAAPQPSLAPPQGSLAPPPGSLPSPHPSPALPQASTDDILASARERVQSRSAANLRDAKPESHAPAPQPSTPRFDGAPPPEVEPRYAEAPPAYAEPAPASAPDSFETAQEAEHYDHDPVLDDPAQPAPQPHRQEPSFGAQGPPVTRQPPEPRPADPRFEIPPQQRPSAPQAERPAGRRSQSWAPPAPRGGPPQHPAPAQGRGGRMPPPLPQSPGPMQVPGQIAHPFPAAPAPRAPGTNVPNRDALQSRVPWPEAIEAPSPERSRQPGPERMQRQPGPRTVVTTGQLVHNIPGRMRVGISLVCEARIGRADVKAIVEGLQGGGAVVREEIMVTKAMSVRLRSPDGGFFIEGSSPETQWIENMMGLPAEDFARWRWTITPREKGRKRLQLIVSARTVGADGLAAETAMPDQVIEVRVKTNYAKTAWRWLGWASAAILGGILARFGEIAFFGLQSIKNLFGI